VACLLTTIVKTCLLFLAGEHSPSWTLSALVSRPASALSSIIVSAPLCIQVLCHNRVPVLWPSQSHAETTAAFAPRHCYLGSNTHPGCRRAHIQCKFHHRSFGLLYALVLPCAGRERRRVLPCFLPAKLSRTTQSVLHSPVCFTLSCSRSISQDLNDRHNVFQDTSSSSSSPRKIKLTHHPLWQPL
jgi:hypothetical protein